MVNIMKMIIIQFAAEIHPPPWEIALKSKEIATITSENIDLFLYFVLDNRQWTSDKQETLILIISSYHTVLLLQLVLNFYPTKKFPRQSKLPNDVDLFHKWLLYNFVLKMAHYHRNRRRIPVREWAREMRSKHINTEWILWRYMWWNNWAETWSCSSWWAAKIWNLLKIPSHQSFPCQSSYW